MKPAGRRGAALVTGGARRIGRALVLTLVEAGYAVAIHLREDCADAEALVAGIAAGGGRAALVKADLARESETAGLIDAAVAAVGPLTLLINNASLFRDDRVGGLSRESWDAHMEANLRAPVVLSEAFAAQAAGGEGDDPSILNLLDQRVWKPNPQFFTYTLSKAALWTATRMLAQALAPRVRVNAIGPGPTLPNPIHGEAGLAAEAAGTLLGHGAKVEDICAAARYLIDARAVTGQMIAVDAGQHLAWKTPDILGD
ncbi:MAG TPA: SDR family oxidoreductase [Caulobacteraceae bacterium]|jgi:NAD(P)-dependent dehydrogenase (short-subunit alcohol dehydrogenase family)|nr:SDR family oxidoreductase [Caulobacteraceae bacterium]